MAGFARRKTNLELCKTGLPLSECAADYTPTIQVVRLAAFSSVKQRLSALALFTGGILTHSLILHARHAAISR